MVSVITRNKSTLKAVVVFFVIGLMFIPGYSIAGTPSVSSNEPVPQPAYITSLDDLKDVQVTPRSSAFHPLVPTSADVDIPELLLQVNESLMLGYLENLTSFGPRLTGTEECDNAAHYLYDTFKDMGLPVRYHNYTDDTVSGSNVEATLYGTDTTNIFIICGHYDTVSAGPGADDDGSGVAAALAAAEIMRNYEFSHTVRFVAFSGEEQGLIGSRHYAEDAFNANETIVAVLNADMIGFALSSSDGSMGKIYQNTASEWIVDYTNEINQLYSEYIGIELFSQGESSGSDHWYFWEYGYDAIFYAEYNFNDYYHSDEDTIANMNLTYLTHFTRLILATLAEMAQAPRPVLEITDITGGLGVSAIITNVGDANATDVNMTVKITGGLFDLIDVSKDTSTGVLPSDESMQSKVSLFRLGSIAISVTAIASNADQVTRHATAFLFGPFVFKVTVTP